MVDQTLLERVTRLPRPERLEVFDALRQTLGEGEVTVTPEIANMLDGRLADLRNNPSAGISVVDSVASLQENNGLAAYSKAMNEVQPWPQFDVYDATYRDSLPQRWSDVANLWSKLANESEQYQ